MPTRRLPEHVKANARRLRREMTDAEARLWYALRRYSVAGRRFRRQHPLGPYILDFYCADARLVVEVDGGQHYEPMQAIRDDRRTRFLKACGLRLVRFTNIEVLTETQAVLDEILLAVEGAANPSP